MRVRKWNGGFTLIETLVVVSVLVVVLALAVVNVIHYQRYLKIAELDNAARGIYMAAQNRAALLQGSGRLEGQLEGSTSIRHDSPNLEELVPVGTIDPELREGQFWVVYEPESGSVTDVFFVERNKGDIQDLGTVQAIANDRDARMNMTPMVGWYGTEVDGLAEEINTHPLGTPGVEVLIENRDELTLSVRYTLPEGLPSGTDYDPRVTLEYQGQEIELLKKDGEQVSFPKAEGAVRKGGATAFQTATSNVVEFVWVLDSLEAGKQFKDLRSEFDSPIELGDDFRVRSDLKLLVPSVNDYAKSEWYASGEDNSLFAKGSTYGNGIAAVNTLRHLQNLHTEWSEVGDGTIEAIQLGDINCVEAKRNDGTTIEAAYKFSPIVNDKLQAYDGKQKKIENLYINSSETSGLFGNIKSVSIQGVRLVQAKVQGASSSVGGLAGSAIGCKFTDCWIQDSSIQVQGGVSAPRVGGLVGRVTGCEFMECRAIDTVAKVQTGATHSSAGGLIGSVSETSQLNRCWVYCENSSELVNADGTTIEWNVSSSEVAGGLIGQWYAPAGGTLAIQNCLAATTVKGSAEVGGLIGYSEGVTSIKTSYANGYLDGAMVGGLIGENKGSLTVASAYAAGFSLADPEYSYGLLGGDVPSAIEDTYSVFRVLKSNGGVDRPSVMLYGAKINGVYDKASPSVQYLRNEDSLAGYECGGAFETENLLPETHAYNIRSRVWGLPSLTGLYEFPGLNEIPHYGDWATIGEVNFPSGLVYWEVNTSGKYGVWGLYKNQQINTLQAGGTPSLKQDGYAWVFKDDNMPRMDYQILYGNMDVQNLVLKLPTVTDTKYYWEWNGLKEVVEPFTVPDTTGNFVVFKLPSKLVTGDLPGGDVKFLQEVIGKYPGESYENVYYFNPHFAKTVRAPKEDGDRPADPTNLGGRILGIGVGNNDWIKDAWIGNAIAIRTPRHFFSLSQFQDEYVKEFSYLSWGVFQEDNSWDFKRYYFLQEMDLDYNVYEWQGVYQPTKVERSAPLNSYYIQDQIGKGFRPEGHAYEWEDDGLKGVYDGGGHTIRNVAFNTVLSENLAEISQYSGLFRYAEYLWNLTYEVPDGVTFDVSAVAKMHPLSMNLNDYTRYEVKVGLLAGGVFRAKDLKVKAGSVTVISSKDDTDLVVGGVVGYTNRSVGCAAEIDSLTVRGTGEETGVQAGGVQGAVLHEMPNCTAEMGSISVSGTGDCYVGGIAGRSTNNDVGTLRNMNDCSVTVGEMSVESTGSRAYVGGLIGWGDFIWNCEARVTGNLSVKGTGEKTDVYAGGLAGGGSKVTECVVWANKVEALGTGNRIWSGGLLGSVENWEFVKNTEPAQIWVKNCGVRTDKLKAQGISEEHGSVCTGGLVGGVDVYQILNWVNSEEQEAPMVVGGTGLVENCSADNGDTSISVVNLGKESYAGGLVGWLNNEYNEKGTYRCYAVGKLSGNCDAAGGAVGCTGNNLVTTWAVVDVTAIETGDNTNDRGGVLGCHQAGALTSIRYYTGSFRYRGVQYSLKDKELNELGTAATGSPAWQVPWGTEIPTEAVVYKDVPSGVSWINDYLGKNYPYPSGVLNKNGRIIHVGLWPVYISG